MVGDLDIEIKMDKTGLFRLNLFSHSADGYTNYLDNTQRNGLGMTFQKEFDRVLDFLRDFFTGKRKRQMMRERLLENTSDSIHVRRPVKTITLTSAKEK